MPAQPPAAFGKKDGPLGLFMARLGDDNHVIVLQALLNSIAEQKAAATWDKDAALLLCRDIEVDSQLILTGMKERWKEYAQHWHSLLSNKELGPLFQKNLVVEQQPEGWYLRNMGSPDGIKLFYQLTVRDAIVEGNRIYSLFLGQLSRFQEKWAARWDGLEWPENEKVFPLLEASLRRGELQYYKKVHEVIPNMLGEGFQNALRGSLPMVFSTLDELLQHCAWPWNQSNSSQNGLITYIDQFISFYMLWFEEILHWYQRKWRHFTLGPLATAEGSL